MHLLIFHNLGNARKLPIGLNQTYTSLQSALNIATAGDSLILYDATITGGASISNKNGRPNAWIYLLSAPGNNAIIQGGGNAIQFSDCNYWHIEGITIQGQTANGLNIDDAGTFETPAKHFRIVNCMFQNINATGNNDLLKLSGLDSFEIANSTFQNGAAGGSGIDMVGCHYGLFSKNEFINLGSNSIQAKGGTQFIKIIANHFNNGGDRALNLGGSTGLAFFRPQNANFEAADIIVMANLIEGSQASIAYVGSTRVKVCNNTIIKPTKWVFRVLQETVDPARFIPCGNNEFCNNIIYIDQNVSTEVNIGPNVNETSFLVANNLWYKQGSINWRGPSTLPVPDLNQIVSDPLFVVNSYLLSTASPAIGRGKSYPELSLDYFDKKFLNPPSIGYHEGGKSTEVKFVTGKNLVSSITRSTNMLKISNSAHSTIIKIQIFDLQGKLIKSNNDIVLPDETLEINDASIGCKIIIIQFEDGKRESCYSF